jgi:hypothetical protein
VDAPEHVVKSSQSQSQLIVRGIGVQQPWMRPSTW